MTKKRAAVVLLVSLAGILGLAQTTTPNLFFNVPPIHSVNWGQAINDNFTKLDKLLSGTLALPSGFWTGNRGSALTPGGVQLAQGPLNTTAENASNKNQPGGYAGLDLTGNLTLAPSSVIVADNQVGADYGAKIQTADARCGSAPCVIEVNLAGGTWSSHLNLHLGHALLFNAGLTITTGSASLFGNNFIAGKMDASTLTLVPGGGQAAIFGVSSAGVSNIIFSNLVVTVSTPVDQGIPLFSLLAHAVSNVLMNNVRVNYMNTFNLGGGGGSNNLVFINTSATNTGFHLYFAGAATNVRVAGASCSNVGNCVEFFSLDSTVQPDRGTILRTGMAHITVSGVTCDVVGACVWGSVFNDAVISGNYAQHCGDVCFDGEGVANVLWTVNGGRDATNGIFATFASGYGETFRGNYGYQYSGFPLILIKNKDTGVTGHYADLEIVDNDLYCVAPDPTLLVPNPPEVPCAAVQMESTAGTRVMRNHFVNAYLLPTVYGDDFKLMYNDFLLRVPLPASPLSIPSQTGGGYDEIAFNSVRSVVFQQVPCFASSNGDFNHFNSYDVHNNNCLGMSATKAGNIDNGVVHLTQTWWIHDNTWDSLVVTGAAAINVINLGNHTTMGVASN